MELSCMLEFLDSLEKNNNRDWFRENKELYQQAKQDFLELIREMMACLEETDSGMLIHKPEELTFKLMRDTRFSHDKSPYNPTFRAHLSAAGKQPIPVGYFSRSDPATDLFWEADCSRTCSEMRRK